jgi:hypothetical protein
MKRAIFLAAALLLLFGVDIVANDAAFTRDLVRALEYTGNRVVRAVDSTVAYMTGRG